MTVGTAHLAETRTRARGRHDGQDGTRDACDGAESVWVARSAGFREIVM